MTETEQNIYNLIISDPNKTKVVEFYYGAFNYDLPWITTITSITYNYKYVQTNVYMQIYNEQGVLIGEPISNTIEELIKLN